MFDLSLLLDVLHTLGAASWHTLWLPVLLWTSGALIAVAALRLAPDLPPLFAYRFRQAILAALPIGILAAAVVDLPARALPGTGFSASTLSLTTLPGATITPGSVSFTWTHAVGLLTLFAAGAAGYMLTKLGAQIVQTGWLRASFRQQPSAARPDQKQARLEAATESLRSRLSIRRSAQSLIADDASSPMLLPGRPSMIVIPAWMMDRSNHDPDSASALDMSVAHELVHLDRYDDWAALAEQVVGMVAAIHPLVHLLIRDIQQSRETACDAAVLSALRCRRGSYARLLADVATRQQAVPGVALSESTSSLEKRLHAMTHSTITASSPLLRAVSVGVFALLIVGMVACADTPSGADTSETSSKSETVDVNAHDEKGETIDVVTVDEMKSDAFTNATLVGGMKALTENISYPESASQQGVEGRVFVQFTVLKDGSLQDIEVVRSVSPELDAEAMRAVKQSSFEPATMDGEPVPIKMTLPITFRLPDEG